MSTLKLSPSSGDVCRRMEKLKETHSDYSFDNDDDATGDAPIDYTLEPARLRSKFRSVLNMKRNEQDIFDEESNMALGNFVEYLNTVNYRTKKRSPFSTFIPKTYGDAAWSLHWPPYLLIARVIVLVISFILRLSFNIVNSLVPRLRNTTIRLFDRLVLKLKTKTFIRGWAFIVAETALLIVIYIALGFLIVVFYIIKWFLSPINPRPKITFD